jgi:hypothetical protein
VSDDGLAGQRPAAVAGAWLLFDEGVLVPLNEIVDTASMAITITTVATRILASDSHVMWWA